MGDRRNFIKQAALLSGGAGLLGGMPPGIQKALAIDPDPGSTFLDAEHVVLLMQENRSFDHLFGTLQGVRGFNDPRVIPLVSKNPAWLQTDDTGHTYAPFRLDIKDTQATWMSALPHSWASQVDARAGGKHDHWLQAKRSGNKAYQDMPLTMGYYSREDLPFYYALADAFTLCDQHFCASLTATTPNRLFFWTGTIRALPRGDAPANVNNEDVDYDSPAAWSTFPERLEQNGISWKVYQNELSVGTGLTDEEDSWLANFTDNPLEWFSQYRVGFHPAHLRALRRKEAWLTDEIKKLEKGSTAWEEKQKAIDQVRRELNQWTKDRSDQMSAFQRNLHQKAFSTNTGDPFYHALDPLTYQDGGEKRTVNVPKGDVLHQFRKDIQTGQLPAVSWLVAPENFSDHPGAPWYGAWYVSEVLNILTQNPAVWKKTIFILTYDENDGYFDHVPPFVAPNPGDRQTGHCSAGIDTTTDYVTKTQAEALKGKPRDPGRVSPVGLGFRVPMIVASPWSRGGWINSEVGDHTSVLRFLENFCTKKTGKPIRENNISAWRRTICGDLTSVFRPYGGEQIKLPVFVKKDPHIEEIYNARFKGLPTGYRALSTEEIGQVKRDPASSPWMPRQEKGIRPSCALPYQLYAEGALDADKRSFAIRFSAATDLFGHRAAGAPFTAYGLDAFTVRNYAVTAGDHLWDAWPLQDFEQERYHISVHGPNGFYREYTGDADDPPLAIACDYERSPLATPGLSGNLEFGYSNSSSGSFTLEITDNAYQAAPVSIRVAAGTQNKMALDLSRSFGWYDFTLRVTGFEGFSKRYAGRVETGKAGFSDPAMGGVI